MNWKNILSELFSTGLTQAQCAALWGVGQATVSDIARGKTLDPRGSLCMAIMATHAEKFKPELAVAGDSVAEAATKTEAQAV